MPTYTYICDSCESIFELFFYIKDYNEKPGCINCKSKKTHRHYMADITTQSASIKKSDSELKTLGDLAKRNTDRLSNDEKEHLHRKHNEYKDTQLEKELLPKGMTRMKKQPKTIWPT
jgi:putative FmdB family regulatory protein